MEEAHKAISFKTKTPIKKTKNKRKKNNKIIQYFFQILRKNKKELELKQTKEESQKRDSKNLIKMILREVKLHMIADKKYLVVI